PAYPHWRGSLRAPPCVSSAPRAPAHVRRGVHRDRSSWPLPSEKRLAKQVASRVPLHGVTPRRGLCRRHCAVVHENPATCVTRRRQSLPPGIAARHAGATRCECPVVPAMSRSSGGNDVLTSKREKMAWTYLLVSAE